MYAKKEEKSSTQQIAETEVRALSLQCQHCRRFVDLDLFFLIIIIFVRAPRNPPPVSVQMSEWSQVPSTFAYHELPSLSAASATKNSTVHRCRCRSRVPVDLNSLETFCSKLFPVVVCLSAVLRAKLFFTLLAKRIAVFLFCFTLVSFTTFTFILF